ncbi:MAG: serine hydrolase family protein [Bacteriovoracaceae bacterium]|nr:serine hydrolase family protein [Bacteriovoracaceae bacterium]
MNSESKKITFEGLHQSIVQSNGAFNESDLSSYEEIFLLLHGYSEEGKKIYKRLGRKMAEEFKARKVLILAPNGLYPMPRAFPLDKEIEGVEDLLQGFAWYFYHPGSNTFLIDYKIPAISLSSWINKLNRPNLPVTIIGYSQGGYLAPFVAFETKSVKRVIGINCSFREDLMLNTPSFPMDLVQGREDTIIETNLAFERFEKLIERGVSGKFTWVEGADHRLSPDIAQSVLEILKD